MSKPVVVTSAQEIRQYRHATQATVALVPTMGALHDGHRSLIRHAQKHADLVWVSIFVNPTQFGPHEDFDRYPRPLDDDLAICRNDDVDLVFTPDAHTLYPPGQPDVAINVPDLANILEGAARPALFPGVCRVVAKLFNLCQPDIACFGQKDYQQLAIVRAMVRDLAMPLRIVSVPTAREHDGLARSSRNQYLTPDERPRAAALFKALRLARKTLADGHNDPHTLETAMAEILADHGLDTDYAVIRDADNLQPVQTADQSNVALIAARLGSVRLIDNALLTPTS
ncbi:pantoate--beta-alanine ligase [Mucisphaera calidilacus]|uniref:Pantothenate synthetase n=1 Tax=Mucisphaera calidilacus TaxID=2527982 RepID=A0A518C1D7_9BACT|nr:pantoate--beta-alanine ligase [Mucisphaera calidilacus]QDU73030.1 Pantoate-beta-alanine ligase [Mucisphaera calidilacus]